VRVGDKVLIDHHYVNIDSLQPYVQPCAYCRLRADEDDLSPSEESKTETLVHHQRSRNRPSKTGRQHFVVPSIRILQLEDKLHHKGYWIVWNQPGTCQCVRQ
jgi:hypothetical protein